MASQLARSVRFASLMLLAVLASSAIATPHGPAERDGRHALVFGIDGDRLLSFDGAMVAVRQQIGERTGLRLGLSFGWSSGEFESAQDRETATIYPDSTISNDGSYVSDDDRADVDLDLDLLLIRHAGGDQPLRFFYGAGPVLGYDRNKDDGFDVDEDELDTRTRSDSRTTTTWRYGLRVLVGAEWFLNESISVHAEYRAGLTYRSSELEEETLTIIEPVDVDDPLYRSGARRTSESRVWEVASHGARVGVSLFF